MAYLRSAVVVAAIALCATVSAPGTADADRIARACMGSDRASGNTRLCACIQRVADQMLDNREQRLAASFFRDPHRAQEIRQSDRARDERFWLRYRAFGEQAQRYCS